MVSEAVKSARWWDDPNFQDNLIALLIRDIKTLHSCAHVLEPNDFRPPKGVAFGRARWIVADRALAFYKKFKEPMGALLVADVIAYAQELEFGASQIGDLHVYLDKIGKVKPKAPDAIIEKVLQFKSQILKSASLAEMNELNSFGKLTDDKWVELSKKALAANGFRKAPTQYLDTLAQRQARRQMALRKRRSPLTLIDPLDRLVTTVGPKQLGLCLAPYKRGKSMFLEWTTVALARQGCNTLHIPLEDPPELVEDRLDGIISGVPTNRLLEFPRTLTKRFARFRATVDSYIAIYDGTGESLTIPDVEGIIERYRGEGFIPNALVIDYDKKLRSSKEYKDKRFEIDDTYDKLLDLLAKYNLVGWTASQTQRNTRKLKIISGDHVAEDLGKIQKATCAISMGKGDWTKDSIYLWVAAHRTDRMDVGCEIVPDRERGMIYDETATAKAAADNAVSEDDEDPSI